MHRTSFGREEVTPSDDRKSLVSERDASSTSKSRGTEYRSYTFKRFFRSHVVLYTFFRKLGVAKMRLQGRSRPLDDRDPSCSRENIGQVKRPRCFVMQPGLDRAVLKQKRLRKFVDVCTYQIYMVAICICMYLI